MDTASISRFLTTLGRSTVEAAVLVALVLGIQWVFRKQLVPRWRCALWLVVAARLLLPFSINSITSIFNLLPRWSRPQWSSPVEMGSVAPATAVHPEPLTPAIARGPVPIAISPATPVRHRAWPWPVWLFAVWLAGAVFLAGHILISSLRLRRRCGRLRPLVHPVAGAVLQECSERLQLARVPTLLESVEVGSPALHGLFRPRLLLPKWFVAGFSAAELRFVFLHELAHLKRRDLWLNWLVAGLQVLHWFNPLLWFGFARWRADRELACDTMALDAAGAGQNEAYGRTMLRLLEHLTRPMSTPGLVGILEDKRQLRRRIGMIADYVPARRWPWLALLLGGALAVVGLTDAQTQFGAAADSRGESGGGHSTTAATNSDSTETASPAGPSHLARDLVGAWGLVGSPGHIGKVRVSGGRIKFFTGTHWCITQSDPKNDVVVFHHGGTYRLKGNEYIETVRYASPSTMNRIGKTNTFLINIIGDTLTDIGINNGWREVWKRLPASSDAVSSKLAKELTGTWVAVGSPGHVAKSPAPGACLKFCAGGYWCDTAADPKNGVVVVQHGGTYRLKRNKYFETVQYAEPVTMNLVGHTYKFDINITGNTLTLKGIGNPWNEVWKRTD